MDTIGNVLPYAIGIAISPVPIAAAILLLLGPGAPRSAVGFGAGWVIGIVAAVSVLTWLLQLLPGSEDTAARPVVATVQLILAGCLLALAARQWRHQMTPDAEPATPPWMRAIDRTTPIAAVGLGLALAAANPKNLLLAASSASVISASDSIVAGLAVHSILASSTVVAPIVYYLIAGDRAAEALQRLRTWLTEHNSAIMTGVLLVLAASLVGKALGNL